MAIQYDIKSIFRELRNAVEKSNIAENATDIDKENENDSIESPEDAPQTQEVAPATSKSTEDTHGGDEAAREIENSPNSANDGKNSKNTKKSEGEELPDKYYVTTDAINPSKSKPATTPENLINVAKKFLATKEEEQKNFETKNRQEYLKKYILEIIKKIAAQHAGIDKQDGVETYDKKQIVKHMLTHQNYRLLGDKYDLKDARYVQFFIDTSGVYGCGSNKIIQEIMPVVISILEKQGYECYIAACGNGFYGRDMVEDEYYGTRRTLESYKAGIVSKIACPTPQTAAQMANDAEFSIILADFDGLSSICEMANLCQKDKVPYFLCTEDRYPWEDPTLHDWVDPDLCDYNPELVYDVSMDGNPTLEQYDNENDYYDYDNDNYDNDDYDDYHYDDVN